MLKKSQASVQLLGFLMEVIWVELQTLYFFCKASRES